MLHKCCSPSLGRRWACQGCQCYTRHRERFCSGPPPHHCQESTAHSDSRRAEMWGSLTARPAHTAERGRGKEDGGMLHTHTHTLSLSLSLFLKFYVPHLESSISKQQFCACLIQLIMKKNITFEYVYTCPWIVSLLPSSLSLSLTSSQLILLSWEKVATTVFRLRSTAHERTSWNMQSQSYLVKEVAMKCLQLWVDWKKWPQSKLNQRVHVVREYSESDNFM